MAQPFIHTSELCWSPQELGLMAQAIESCFCNTKLEVRLSVMMKAQHLPSLESNWVEG
ncbi:FtsK/SpoIIIE family protein [Proteus mirabilis]|nr:FtsK/SpoIIIE family protein [Proteus mirabilis]